MSQPKKVLFTSHTANFQKFNRPFMRMLKEQGWEVHYASAGEEEIFDADKAFTVPFERSPFKPDNIKAYFALKKIIDREKYDMIHTHTPMGGVVTRLAARAARKQGTRVLYTAHGFHFFKGAPLTNWLIYYPIEKYMARHTDTLITINNEDFERAKAKFKTRVEYVPGVGVDLSRFEPRLNKIQSDKLRASIGIKPDDFVMIYPAEISKRKRQLWLVKAISRLLLEKEDIHLLLPGGDSLGGRCQRLVAKSGLQDQVHFLGYRNDIANLMMISDLAVSSSSQEGLPVNLLEALAAELPIIATNSRGNRDLVQDGRSGYIIELKDSGGFSDAVNEVYRNLDKRLIMCRNTSHLLKARLISDLLPKMNTLYDNETGVKTGPVRVLQIVTSMNRAGLETMLMNYYRQIDRSQVQFDFLVHRETEGAYEQEIVALGGRIYRFAPINLMNIPGYVHGIRDFLRQHPEYRVVHSHLDALSALPLKGAKKAGVPVRIGHSHNNGFSLDAKLIVRHFYKLKISRYATYLLACSEDAGRFMFGRKNKFSVMRNAIELENYKYNPDRRLKIRDQFNISPDERVVGHVGRLTDQKNQEFLVDVLSKISLKDDKVKLMLVGEGESYGMLKRKVESLGLSDRVLFLGSRSDIPQLLSAMDIFALPSRYEGLGIAAIEAQVNGLPVVMSNKTSREAGLSSRAQFLAIDGDSKRLWVDAIYSANRLSDSDNAKIRAAAVKKGYDISSEAQNLVRLYVGQ